MLLAVGALVALVTAVRGEWNPAADYDAFWFWLPRAETIFYAHQLDPGLWSQFAHGEYPPLMPVMTAMTFAFTGGFHPSLLPFQQALLGIAFLLAVLALLDRFVPRWLSVPMLALLGTAPWFWGKLESPMPDQTLAYLIALAALACVLWLCEPAPAWLALGAPLPGRGCADQAGGDAVGRGSRRRHDRRRASCGTGARACGPASSCSGPAPSSSGAPGCRARAPRGPPPTTSWRTSSTRVSSSGAPRGSTTRCTRWR